MSKTELWESFTDNECQGKVEGRRQGEWPKGGIGGGREDADNCHFLSWTKVRARKEIKLDFLPSSDN